jgi:RNA recognition motif-containing protein
MSNALGDKVHCTIWVGNIPSRYATKERLVQVFSEFGEVQSATVRKKEGCNKSWAFVTFASGKQRLGRAAT